MFPYRIAIEWSASDDAYVARVPAFPNLAAHGDTPAEAAAEAESAGRMMLEVLGKKAPASDLSEGYSGNLRLRIPRQLHAVLAAQASMGGVSLNTQLVELLSKRWPSTTSIVEVRRPPAKDGVKKKNAGKPVKGSAAHKQRKHAVA